MKKLKYITCLLSAGLLFGSCQKQLDISPEGARSEGNFWQTGEDALLGVNSMYIPFDGEEFYGRGFMWFINASDDMVTGRINTNADNIKNFNRAYYSSSYTVDQWDMRYAVIRRANDVINKVPAISMDAALKKRYLGEAHFLGALMYFQLTYNYADNRAGVPLITPENNNDPNPTPRAANANANYDYIEAELKKAANMLPYLDQLAAADYGRPHKVAAWGYLSKMYLYKKDWANAEKYADSVITFGKRELLNNYADVFKAANNYSTEYIWSAVGTAKGPAGWGSILPGVMLENKGWGIYNGWGYYQPTKELYDAFEAGDKRREVTILKPGDKHMFFGAERTYSSVNSLSGYQFNKYMEPFTYANPVGTSVSPNGDHPTTNLNVPLMRFAEVLLIKAEAALMQNKNADDPINKVRRRAGLLGITNATMAELKKQRRCELAGEWADRHRDLVRWGDAQAAYAQPLHGVTGSVIWPARTFDPVVNGVWAVPQKEIDRSNGVIKQNAGW
ncbi:RagB/SusD family nutrient uptake outer membrane protein [Mucilaginibacter conchicola]|uniref:RagB/SusD family nutrient uptake outer membrane protein n=1 Tax=Mucilaginibacter conchicola TaxID=2303333 RepID=A0A372NNL2_9SPHI|nr:RagB/SusD family nutrient uptake outer membrane protein [Mucilaginibacter conchicola]RFZ90458.1 RagB/SusD family nutrient uptake outer membrane protein [Mucilaginibacter conchicola]